MSLIVQKFGGSSVCDYAHLLRMARIVKSRVDEGDDVVVVLSAQGDTTDGLLQKAKEISEQPSPRELDMLLSAGEQMSAALGAMTLRSIGVEAVSLCAWQIPIETDGTHGNAEIELIDTTRIRKELAEGRVVVAAGFQGVDENGDVTTLGRGGSDTSAVALAAALKADELIIYTDVDGIFSADPRICKNAVRREVISYDDMLLLAQKGAQVLHDRSVALAQAGGVPITVRSCREGGAGSIVCETDEDASVVGVTQKKSGRSRLAAITAVGGALPSIEKEKIAVTALERAEITVFAVAEGERFMSFYVLRDDAERALQLVHDALIAAKWPEYREDLAFKAEESHMESVMDAIRAIRNRRAEMNVPPSRKAALYVLTSKPQVYAEGEGFIQRLAYADTVTMLDKEPENLNGMVTIPTADAKLYIPMGQLVDVAKELDRISKELEKNRKFLSSLEAKLSNEKFVSRAPEAVVNAEKEKAQKARDLIASLEQSEAALKSL